MLDVINNFLKDDKYKPKIVILTKPSYELYKKLVTDGRKSNP